VLGDVNGLARIYQTARCHIPEVRNLNAVKPA